MENTPRTAGWREVVALPDWGITALVAKLDSGARSSCIDARGMEIIEGEEHGEVRFTVPAPDGDITRQERILDWRMVRDSGGHSALRPVIAVRMELAGESWDDEATLYDRSEISHRVLIGRRVMADRFIIDPSRGFILTPRPHGVATTDGAEAADVESD